MIWEGKDAHLLFIRPDHGKHRVHPGRRRRKRRNVTNLPPDITQRVQPRRRAQRRSRRPPWVRFHVRGRRPMAGRGARAVGQTGAGTGGNTGPSQRGHRAKPAETLGKAGGDTGTETGGDAGDGTGGLPNR